MNATPRWLTSEQKVAWDSFIRMQETLIGRLSRLIQSDSHMSASDYLVLASLTERGGGRMRFLDLAKSVEWEKSRMSHQVRRMTTRGLVAREECPDDGRGAFIVATPAGYKAIEEAAPVHVDHVHAAVHRRPHPGRTRHARPDLEPRPRAYEDAARLTDLRVCTTSWPGECVGLVDGSTDTLGQFRQPVNRRAWRTHLHAADCQDAVRELRPCAIVAVGGFFGGRIRRRRPRRDRRACCAPDPQSLVGLRPHLSAPRFRHALSRLASLARSPDSPSVPHSPELVDASRVDIYRR